MWSFSQHRRDPAPVPADSDDGELLAAVAVGQVEALRLLHHRHAPWLRARLTRRCADPDVVDAALQDTFVAVWHGAGRYRPGPRPDADAGAWLWTIASRKQISVLRSRGARWIGQGHELGDSRLTTDSAEEQVLTGVEHTEVGGALARLSPELRLIVQVCVLDGRTAKEASGLLGIPVGTVKTRMRRAKARLREELA